MGGSTLFLSQAELINFLLNLIFNLKENFRGKSRYKIIVITSCWVSSSKIISKSFNWIKKCFILWLNSTITLRLNGDSHYIIRKIRRAINPYCVIRWQQKNHFSVLFTRIYRAHIKNSSSGFALVVFIIF